MCVQAPREVQIRLPLTPAGIVSTEILMALKLFHPSQPKMKLRSLLYETFEAARPIRAEQGPPSLFSRLCQAVAAQVEKQLLTLYGRCDQACLQAEPNIKVTQDPLEAGVQPLKSKKNAFRELTST